MSYPTIAFENIQTELPREFKRFGVVVITGVFTSDYCDQKMDEIVSAFECLGTGINRNNLSDTWTRNNLPPQTRPGMYQCLMGHIQPVWDIRGDARVRKIYEVLYSDLRGKEVKDFITSFDGMTVIPNTVGPYQKSNTKDWAHLDQSTKGDKWKCAQGQAVLTNTTAAFRCTPRSCHYHDEILDLAEVSNKDKSNWVKFKQPGDIQEYCEGKGLEWQIPIHAPKGSFILWSSSTIHSAKYPDYEEKADEKDVWKGWRGVVYVCFRPREEVSTRARKNRRYRIRDNRLTNHWSERTFGKTPGGRFLYIDPRHPVIEDLLHDSSLLYDIYGHPVVAEDLV